MYTYVCICKYIHVMYIYSSSASFLCPLQLCWCCIFDIVELQILAWVYVRLGNGLLLRHPENYFQKRWKRWKLHHLARGHARTSVKSPNVQMVSAPEIIHSWQSRTHPDSPTNSVEEKEEKLLVSQLPWLANINIISFLSPENEKNLEVNLSSVFIY